MALEPRRKTLAANIEQPATRRFPRRALSRRRTRRRRGQTRSRASARAAALRPSRSGVVETAAVMVWNRGVSAPSASSISAPRRADAPIAAAIAAPSVCAARIATSAPAASAAASHASASRAESRPESSDAVADALSATTASCCETAVASSATRVNRRGTTRPFSTRRSRKESSVWLSGYPWRSYRIRRHGSAGSFSSPSASARDASERSRVDAAAEDRRRSATPMCVATRARAAGARERARVWRWSSLELEQDDEPRRTATRRVASRASPLPASSISKS